MSQMKAVSCPSCGGDIEVATLATCSATCPYCESRVIVNQAAIEARGKMSLLAELPSCLSVGWPAEVDGRQIEVLGRIQYKYNSGIWDEWWIQYVDDESYAWISQDEGRYMLETPLETSINSELFDQVDPGEPVTLAGHNFFVQEVGEAVMVGMQGQLPFNVDPDEIMRFIDLTDNKRKLTIELFADGSQEVFFGQYLNKNKLRSYEDGEVEATSPLVKLYGPPDFQNPEHPIISASEGVQLQTVACPSCGGSVDVDSQDGIAMVTCGYCGSGLDVTVPGTANLLYRAQKTEIKIPIPLGATGTLMGETYRVAGRVRYVQVDEGVKYYWTSCQLINLGKGENAFLEYENGHWCLFTPLQKSAVQKNPKYLNRGGSFSHFGQSYKVFENDKCTIDCIDGELTWVARVGDFLRFMDAVRPPQMLSAEWNNQEIEWSMGRYLKREQVIDAFQLDASKVPNSTGVHPAQPFESNFNQKFKAGIGAAVGVFMALMFLFAWTKSGTVVLKNTRVQSSRYTADAGYISPEFEIPSGTHICKLTASSNGLNNQWVSYSVAFIDEDEKVLTDAESTVEYYSGTEGGESWSEGSKSKYVMVRLVGPKKYRVNIFGEAGSWSRAGGDRKISGGPDLNIEIRRNVGVARYYFIGMILAFIYPVYRLVRWISFRSTKWNDG